MSPRSISSRDFCSTANPKCLLDISGPLCPFCYCSLLIFFSFFLENNTLLVILVACILPVYAFSFTSVSFLILKVSLNIVKFIHLFLYILWFGGVLFKKPFPISKSQRYSSIVLLKVLNFYYSCLGFSSTYFLCMICTWFIFIYEHICSLEAFIE